MEFLRQEYWSGSIPFSRESSQSRAQTWVPCTAGRVFIIWATRGALYIRGQKIRRDTASPLPRQVTVSLGDTEGITVPYSLWQLCFLHGLENNCISGLPWLLCTHAQHNHDPRGNALSTEASSVFRGARCSTGRANTQHVAGAHIRQTNPAQIISNSFESGATLSHHSQRPANEIAVTYLGLEFYKPSGTPWPEILPGRCSLEGALGAPHLGAVGVLTSRGCCPLMSLQNQHSCVDRDHLPCILRPRYIQTPWRLMKAVCLSSSQSQKTVTKK